MTRNVTITVDEEALRWARHRAADLDTSVSRFIGDLLAREMRQQDASLAALEQWREMVRKGWPGLAGDRLTREEANERPRKPE